MTSPEANESPVAEGEAPTMSAEAVVTDSSVAAPSALEPHPAAAIFPLLEGTAFEALKADIAANGLRLPIVLHGGLVLDGRNRLRACKELGIEPKTVQPRIDDPVAYVVSTNLLRRHLDESQRAMCAARAKGMFEKAARERQREGGRKKGSADLREAAGKSAAKAAELFNVSPRTVESACAVMDRGAPELVAAVDQGEVAVSAAARILELPKAEQAKAAREGRRGVIAAAYELRERRNAEIAKNGKPLGKGSYGVILADPPWRYDFTPSAGRAIENHYPTMSLDEIKALPVAGIAAEDCVLFLWATSPKLAEAMEVLAAWGFAYRTNMAWVKDKIGMGRYVREKHEQVLIATRGSPPTPAPARRPPSVFEAPRRRHSEKPAVLYELIEAMYPTTPRVELFARARREGWEAWGNEVAEGVA